jgi:hypothetical protein
LAGAQEAIVAPDLTPADGKHPRRPVGSELTLRLLEARRLALVSAAAAADHGEVRSSHFKVDLALLWLFVCLTKPWGKFIYFPVTARAPPNLP